MKSLLTKCLNIILPMRCVICHDCCRHGNALCPACTRYLKKNNRNNKQFFAPFRYDDILAKMITNLKFKKELMYADILGQLFLDELSSRNRKPPQAIIPMPLHPQRLRHRGFNQAVEIAKPIVKRLAIPNLIHVCRRHRATTPQTLLKTHEREKNMLEAFEVIDSELPEHIAIFDDVYTTGATSLALKSSLKTASQQPKTIEIWTLARA